VSGQATRVVTFDSRMADAAVLHGLQVVRI
jgi:hypothetical protein